MRSEGEQREHTGHGEMRSVALLSAMMLALSMPGPVWAVRPSPAAPADITSTERGLDVATEAAARFTSYGVPTEAADLAVFEHGDGSLVVVPQFLSSTLDAELLAEGEVVASVEVGAALSPDRGGRVTVPGGRSSPQVDAAASAYWSVQEQGCLSSLRADSARFDSCYYIYKLINDGTNARSYWALRHKGTAFEYEHGLRSAWISGERTPGTGSQSWIDWAPEQGHTGSCSTVGLSVSHVVSLSYSAQACETWSVDKSCNGCSPYFRNTWDCSCWFGLGTKRDPITRAVAYQLLVSMSNSALPRFRLGIGMAA